MPRRRETKDLAARCVEAVVEEIGAKGDGVFMLDGAPVYAPFTVAGDAGVFEVRGERALLIERRRSGADRTRPPCPHFADCGGCALQHVRDDAYVCWKERSITTVLERAGLDASFIEPLRRIAPASRRRAQFYVEKTQSAVRLGFYARRSRRLVAIGTCNILHPDLKKALVDLRRLAEATPRRWSQFSMATTLCDNSGRAPRFDVNFSHTRPLEEPGGQALARLVSGMKKGGVIRASLHGDALAALETPVIDFGGVLVAPPPGCFLQASRAAADLIRVLAFEALNDAACVADLFSGCGAFALPLAAQGARVDAFDSDGPAIEALVSAAKAHGCGAVKGERRDLFQRPLTADELGRYDAVIVDPPRAGAVQQARELAGASVATLVYVSCNPNSFARDARFLINGGWRLDRVTPVDQFAYSPHTELVARFSKA